MNDTPLSSPTPLPPRTRRPLWPWALAVAAAGAGAWSWQSHRQSPTDADGRHAEGGERRPAGATNVEVATPRRGGIDRVSVQPGTVEPFEAADLYAKVSGFLDEQSADIGKRVKKGDVLAKIAVPELDRQVERDEAKYDHAKATVKQAEARIAAAEADARASASDIALSKSQVKAKASYRAYRDKQLARIRELSAQQAVEGRLVDESRDQYESAVESENAAKEGVTAAEQRAEAARAKVAQARADLEEAKAEVKVAAADWEKSKVLAAYATIASPYDGVVTKRSFNRGDFVRSADAGGDRVPLLAVERTDLMRVVVQVPDRDVPFVDVGDPATVETDALPGQALKTKIARSAESEDLNTRTMRTEIDVPNADGRLRRGMYGRVTILLQRGSAAALTIPSAALAGKAEASRATVRVVRDDKAYAVPVVIGADNGVEVEVLSGLPEDAAVIVRANGPVDDGSPVTVSGNKSKPAGH